MKSRAAGPGLVDRATGSGHGLAVRAAVLRDAAGPFSIEDVTVQAPLSGEVVIRVSGVGICHTDLLPRTPVVRTPIITGHEAAGVVEELGPDVVDFEVGDHVVITFDTCGSCASCHAAHPAYCETFWPRNMTGFREGRPTTVRDADGEPLQGRWFGQSSFATRCVAPARNLLKVDSALPLELLGPLTCSVLTGAGSVFNSLRVSAGTSIAVFGTGAVGLSSVMAASVAGATTIVAIDLSPDRLSLAAEVGATHTIDASSDVLPQLRSIAPRGLDCTLDTTGVPDVISDAIDALRVGGTCGLLGVPRGDLSIKPEHFALGRTVKGILEGDAVPKILIPQLIELWNQGRFPFHRLITTFPLDEINDAEHAMHSARVVKPVLLP